MTTNDCRSHLSYQNGVILQGYQKKLKTLKKKYFVLYEEVGSNLARLEYFDSEKKFRSKSVPKRTIKLRNCLNINRRLDTKYENVITLSMKEGGFGIIMDSEENLNKWLRALLKLQRGEDVMSDPLKPLYG